MLDYLDEDESVKLGDRADAVLHFVLSHLGIALHCITLHCIALHCTLRIAQTQFCVKKLFLFLVSHLNKLAVFFLLEQRVEPVHCHPVVLLDLRQADPGYGDDGDGDDDSDDGDGDGDGGHRPEKQLD